MDKSENRLYWIDQLKGFGIVLVVFGHAIEYVDYSVGEVSSIMLFFDFWLTSFHMPLFFLLSAYLQRYNERRLEKGYSYRLIRNKLLNLGIPYVFFSFMYFISKLIMSGSIQNPVDCLDLLFLWIEPLSTLWFIYLLLVFYLFRTVIYNLNIPNICVLGITILLCISSYYISIPPILQDTVLLRFMRYALYYSIGIQLCDWQENISVFYAKYKKKIVVFLTMLSIALLLLCLYKKISIIMILFALIQILLFVFLSYGFKNNLFIKLGENSLGIYLMHDYIICLVVIICKKMITNNDLIILCSFIFGLFISYCIFVMLIKIGIMNWLFKPSILLEKRGKKNELRTKN